MWGLSPCSCSLDAFTPLDRSHAPVAPQTHKNRDSLHMLTSIWWDSCVQLPPYDSYRYPKLHTLVRQIKNVTPSAISLPAFAISVNINSILPFDQVRNTGFILNSFLSQTCCIQTKNKSIQFSLPSV